MASKATEQTILLVDPDLDYLDWATKHLDADGVRSRVVSCSQSGEIDYDEFAEWFGVQEEQKQAQQEEVRAHAPV